MAGHRHSMGSSVDSQRLPATGCIRFCRSQFSPTVGMARCYIEVDRLCLEIFWNTHSRLHGFVAPVDGPHSIPEKATNSEQGLLAR